MDPKIFTNLLHTVDALTINDGPLLTVGDLQIDETDLETPDAEIMRADRDKGGFGDAFTVEGVKKAGINGHYLHLRNAEGKPTYIKMFMLTNVDIKSVGQSLAVSLAQQRKEP